MALTVLLPPQAASARGTAVTLTQATALVPLVSAGSVVTPAASSTRCPCLEGPGAMASTVKVLTPLCPLLPFPWLSLPPALGSC